MLKWLFTLDSYADLDRTRASIHAPWRSKRFEQAHAAELAAIDHARQRLAYCGVSETVRMDKVTAMIEQKKAEISDLTAAKQRVERRISKLILAQEEINRQQNSQPEQVQPKKQREERL